MKLVRDLWQLLRLSCQRKLGVRLLAALLGVSAGFAVISSAWDYSREEEALREDLLVRGRSLARQAALVCPEFFVRSDWPMLEDYAADLVRSEKVLSFVVFVRVDDATIVGYPKRTPAHPGPDTLEISAPILLERGGAQIGRINLGLSLGPAKEALRQRTMRLLWHSSLGFLLVGAVMWLVLRFAVLRPIRRLDAEAHRLGGGNLELALPDFGQTELGRLGRTLDEMRQNLRANHAAMASQNQRLLELDRLKSQFLANVSHEMRTPLTTILGRIELLTDPAIGESERGESVAAVQRNGEQLFELVDRLLDLAKLETGKLLIDERPCRPAEVIAKACERLRGQADEKGLYLRVDTKALASLTVRTDPVRLQQLVANVVDNAVKFTETGGVEVTAGFEPGHRRLLRIVVRDTGPGIPAEFRAEEFAAFHQADGSLTRRHGGSGLGLHMAQQIARRLGGDVVLGDAEGGGAQVVISVAAPEIAAGRDSATVPGGLKGRVLVVDDARDNQRLLQAILTRLGLTVELADNGRIAVERLTATTGQAPFDLVLMDLQMPEVDGITAIRQLRELGCEVPIVSLTAHALADDRERCLAAGASGYETKPISRQRLSEIVAKHVPLPSAQS